MKFLRHLPFHARLVAGILITLLLVGLVVILSSLAGWYAENNQRIDDLEPRIGRMRGFTTNTEQLERSVRQARQQLTRFAYPATGDTATVGARVQQELRGYLEQAGISVTGSQVMEAESLEGFEEIRVDVSATGSVEALDQILLALQEARPLLLIDSLELSPARTRRGDNNQRLIIRMKLSALRLEP